MDDCLDQEFGILKKKPCPKCAKGIMVLNKDIDYDEQPYGDESDGDFEIGTSRVVYYECDNVECKHDEIISSEFKGSGLLR